MARKRKPARGGPVSPLDALGEVLVWCTVVWAVFAIGGTTGPSVVGLWGLANLSCLVNVLASRFRIDVGVAVLSGLAAWTLVQSVLLPASVVAALDSDIAQTWIQTQELLGAPKLAALSLQPLSTRLEAMKLWAYALTWGCIVALVARHGTDAVVQRIVWVVVAVVGVTVLHRVLGWQRVYTWYQPQQVEPHWVGPILNPNNLGGLCNLGAFAALALTLRGTNDKRDWFKFIGVALALTVMTLLTGSRGAVASLGLGLVVFSLLLWRNRATISSRRWGGVVLVAVGLILGALVIDQERLLAHLGDRSVDKFRLLGWAIDVVKLHPMLGIGKGALQAEIPVVQPAVGRLLFPYVECFPLDWATGWGMPIALTLVALTLGALVKLKGGFRTNILRCALCVVLIQNLFDLGLEVPGVALPWLCVFAAARKSALQLPALTRKRRYAYLGVLAGFVALVFGLGLPTRGAAETRWNLATALSQGDAVPLEELRTALSTNPGDHALLRTTALRSATLQEPKTLAWMNLALRRAPEAALSYLSLGQILWTRGAKQQALGAFRRAALDASVHDELETWLLARDPLALSEVAPRGPSGAEFLRKAALTQSDVALRRRLYEAAIEQAPDDLAPQTDLLEWQVGLLVEGRDDGCLKTEECLGNLEARVKSLAVQAREFEEPDSDTRQRVELLSARVRSLRGQSHAALEEVRPICRAAPADVRCARAALELGRRVGEEAFDEVAAAYLDAFCVDSKRCDTERINVAADLAAAGRLTAALRHYVASASEGIDVRAFIGAADVAARLGREHEAVHWLAKGEQRFGADPGLEAQRARLGLPQRPHNPEPPSER